MKKRRFTEVQILGFLKQAETGLTVKELCRSGGFSDTSFYKWRAKYRCEENPPEAVRLHALEGENEKLKQLLAEAHLYIHALKKDFSAKP